MTDNGSNYLKIARLFSQETDAPQFDEEFCDDTFEEVEFLDLMTILSNRPSTLPDGELPLCLPPHPKCACHLSNLCCSADIKKIRDVNFNRIFASVEPKISKLCSSQNMSDNTSDLTRQELGGKFMKENDTRWNSTHRI